MKALSKEKIERLVESFGFSRPDPEPVFTIVLHFDGPFLVNDPSKLSGKGDPDQRPLADAEGNPHLPAKSVRGALRAQAERIIRTMGGRCCDKDNPCKNSQKHCIACEIFGCTGWKSTLRISDFHYQGEKRGPRTQPFVAIDRFHGGGKDTALFQAEYFESPKLEGRLTLALKDNSPDELAWRKGLLGLLFRDLREGDIPFGFGASKGYGRITQAEITPLDEITEDDITTFRKKCLENSGEYSCERAKIPERTDQSGRAAITPGNPQDNRIHNPYHFIPAPRPDTGHWTPVDRSQRQAVTAQSHHSHAFYRDTSDDGQPLYHGRIGCRITTETPIFIGAGDADQPQHGDSPAPLKKPYKLNGALAIPAASLRGMISSLTEAASNSAMRELDSEALLSYRKSATPGEALSRLGIIIRDAGNQLKLLPVDGLMPGPNPIILKDAYTAEPMKAFIQGHNSWSPQNNKILYLDPDQIEAGDHNKKYTSSLPADRRSIGYIPGILRILGKEGREDEMPTKKHEWFIPIPDEVKDFNAYLEQQRNRGLTISPQALKNFHQIADQRTDSQKAKRDRRELEEQEHLPYLPKGNTRNADSTVCLKHGDIVYFKTNQNNTVTEISFSAIWRGRVEDTIKAFIPRDLLPFNKTRNTISPAELLFGFIEKDQDHGLGFAGKVRISAGTLSDDCRGRDDLEEGETMLKVLSSPKPPSRALYFTDEQKAYIEKSKLTSGCHRAQGRKVYLHALRQRQDPCEVQRLDQKGQIANNNQARYPWETHNREERPHLKVRINPIRRDVQFDFTVDFDNLTEWELGLLCYVLRPSDESRHKIGMGKPIGLGSVRIDITSLRTIHRRQRYTEDKMTYERYNQIDWSAEQQARGGSSPDTFRMTFADTVPADIRQALQLFGNPRNVKQPVHYPQVRGHDIEENSYQWFVANDTDSGQMRAEKKVLTPISGDTEAIPVLERYRWNG